MNRFFIPPAQISDDDLIRVTGREDVHHLAKVLRLAKGEKLFVSSGDGRGFLTKVEEVSRRAVVLKINQRLPPRRRDQRSVQITLACAVARNTRFEEVVAKCVQLDVDRIIPLITHRTLVKPDQMERKQERLRRIVVSAAKQSGALFLPELSGACLFADLIKAMGVYDLKLIPNLSHQTVSLRDVVASFVKGRILVLIGPEGDFTRDEINLAFQAGCIGVSLGESVLRVDTAAIAAVSFLKLTFADSARGNGL